MYQLGARNRQHIAHRRRDARCDQHRQQHWYAHFAQNSAEIRTDGIKTCLTERDLTRVTEQDIKSGIDNDVNAQRAEQELHINGLAEQDRVCHNKHNQRQADHFLRF